MAKTITKFCQFEKKIQNQNVFQDVLYKFDFLTDIGQYYLPSIT